MLKKETSALCDTCGSSPSTIFCRADLAYLCAGCDAAIHSANPLAGRHHRVPMMPMIYGHQVSDARSVTGVGSQDGFLSQDLKDPNAMYIKDEEDEAASWLQFEKETQNGEANGFLFDGDDYLNHVEYNFCQDSRFDDYQCNDLQFDKRQMSYGGGEGDSIVPVQNGGLKMDHHDFQHQKVEFATEYETSSNGSYRCPSVQIPTLVDRKASILRYMEKKKRRKFQKTIRYASRKAYAEIRPRVKGRFAKKTNVGVEVEQILSTIPRKEDGYCIVPSF